MIDHIKYREMLGTIRPGRAHKAQSDMVMLGTWDNDIQSQTVYLYDMYHDIGVDHFKLNNLGSENDTNKIPTEAKFIRHEKQTYSKDDVTFWLQFKPGHECVVDYYDRMFGDKYRAIYPIGLFVDIQDESGKYNKWLVVNIANYNQSQFPTYEILRCDYVFQWIHNGKRCECPGVTRSQNS